LFRQVKQSRVFQDVIDHIQEAILEGKLKVGDRLPAERARSIAQDHIRRFNLFIE
jgi:DNA-binding FadR family transcriptional regulator